MNTLHGAAQDPSAPGLSIGDLAERTGVSTATIRMWEARHGFPRPDRLASGHRRYAEADVTALSHVVRRRDAGVRLDAAIAEAMTTRQPANPSVFAELRRRHPHLEVQRLRKPTMVALSWAIEDELGARADRAHLFGAFQHRGQYRAAEDRWTELARVARSTYVFADFETSDVSAATGPVEVHLDDQAPMRREWAVVCDNVDLPVALTGWELPGQQGGPASERTFEALWTIDPQAVRDASRVCARIAATAGAPGAEALVEELAAEPVVGATDPGAATAMFNRAVGYVDRFSGSPESSPGSPSGPRRRG